MQRRKRNLPQVRISKNQARRWLVFKQPTALAAWHWLRELGFTGNRQERHNLGGGGGFDFDYNPDTDRLIEAYRFWQAIEDDAVATKKEIVARLMEYRYIKLAALAEELGISRPTLYAWQREVEAANDPDDQDQADD